MSSTVDIDRLEEFEESPSELDKKAETLAAWVKESKYTVFFTGAGVSTSAGLIDIRF